MKRIVFLNVNGKDRFVRLIEFFKSNIGMCYLVFNLLLGVVIGAMSAKNADELMINRLDFIFNSNVNLKMSQSALENFIASVSSYFIFVMIPFLMGLSLWGFLTAPFIVFFRGFGTGITSGYLCIRYGIFGFAFNVFVLLPGVFLSSIAVVVMSKESMNFSLGMSSKIFQFKYRSKKPTILKNFLIRTGIVLIVIIIAAMVDVLFTNLFAGFFDFSSVLE